MVKVLFLVSGLERQGPINQLYYLCKNLDRERIGIQIVTFSRYEIEKSLRSKFSACGIEVLDLRLSRADSIIRGRGRLQGIVDENNVTIVQSYGLRADYICSGLKRVHRVTSVRNMLLYSYSVVYGRLWGAVLGRLNLRYINAVDTVVACSRSVQEHLSALGVGAEVITNGIEIPDLYQDDVSAYMARIERLGDKRKTFLTVASRLRGKNVEFLEDAFRSEELRGLALNIAGFYQRQPGGRKDSVPNVLLLGHVEDFWVALREADFFVSASLHEGMPNAVLEAMVMGVPVVLSDISEHKEVMERAGSRIGVLFRNNDFRSLCEAISKIRREPYEELARNCVHATRRFGVSEMARKYEKLYDTIGGRGGG